MTKKKTSKINFRRPLQSTQSNIPIAELYNGVIITTDRRYVKIMEIKPITFLMKTAQERANVAIAFQNVLKVCPYNIQIISTTVEADLSAQLKHLDEAQRIEKYKTCKKIDKEYRKRLLDSQKTGISRRFFLCFEYERKKSDLFKSVDVDEVCAVLNNIAYNIESTLQLCGNEVEHKWDNNPNYKTAEILYHFLNRDKRDDKGNKVTFDDNLNEVFERYYKTYGEEIPYIAPTEYIAPNTINYRNKRYVVVNNTYYAFYCIAANGYNPLVYSGWLTPFINAARGVDVSIYLRKSDVQNVIGSIRRNITYAEADLNDNAYSSSASDKANVTFQSANYLRNGINAGYDYYDMSVMLTITGNSAEEIDYKLNDLEMTAITSGIKFQSCVYDAERAFISSLPLVRMDDLIFNKTKRNVLTDGAASTYPFTSFEINDPEGIYLGDDLNSSSMVIMDLFNEKRLLNYNMFIGGASGSGKSFLSMLLATRMRLHHIPIIVLAPEKQNEYMRLCKYLGGEFITMGAGSSTRINIMDIRKPNEEAMKNEALINGGMEDLSLLAEKAETIKDFLGIFYKEMSIEERQLLDKAIIKTYAKFGITMDNSSLIDPENPTKFKKMPILQDLHETLLENPDCKKIANIVDYFVSGSGQAFNGQTNIDTENDFIVFGLEKLGANQALGMFVAMDYAWSRIKENKLQNNALLIDEWWIIAQNPVGAELSMKIARTIRAYHGSLIIATQQFSDILAVDNGKFGNAVLSNCSTTIILKHERKAADTVQRILGLTSEEHDFITSASTQKGDAIFIANGVKLKIHFTASETETALISTAQEDLKKIRDDNPLEKLLAEDDEDEIEVEEQTQPVVPDQQQKEEEPPKPVGKVILDADLPILLSDDEYREAYLNPRELEHLQDESDSY